MPTLACLSERNDYSGSFELVISPASGSHLSSSRSGGDDQNGLVADSDCDRRRGKHGTHGIFGARTLPLTRLRCSLSNPTRRGSDGAARTWSPPADQTKRPCRHGNTCL